MAPLKFDDLAKSAKDVLNDDFQTSGFLAKAKQKTNWHGSVSTIAVDILPVGSAKTPAKVTWKMPKLFGIAGLVVDKFEMDKGGKFKLELSADQALHKLADLKLEAKTDLVNLNKATAACTFVGIKDTQIKLDVAPLDFESSIFEVTRALDTVTVGIKCDVKNVTAPNLGVRVEYGRTVAAVLATQFSVLNCHACVQARDDLKLACSYDYGGKTSGHFGLGAAYRVNGSTSLKAKVQQDGSLSGTLKHDLSKGFTFLAGGMFNLSSGKTSFGLQLSIE